MQWNKSENGKRGKLRPSFTIEIGTEHAEHGSECVNEITTRISASTA